MKLKKILSVILAIALFIQPIASSADAFKIPDNASSDEVKAYLEQFILQNYKGDVTKEQLEQAAIKGMFSVLDPYSAYFSATDYSAFKESLSGTFVGIGVRIEPFENYIRITSPILDSPADKAGIKAGDIITKVNGKSIYGLNTDQASSLIRGDEGTMVKITVIQAATKKEVELNIKRARIQTELVRSKLLEGQIGYVALSEFDKGSATQVINAIKAFNKPKGIILDLRGNPGGYLSEAVILSNYFLPKNSEILKVVYKDQQADRYFDTTDGDTTPLVVLVNKNSASASEIVSIALQKNNRAKIVGETSYGKGTVQDLYELNNGSGVKLTIAEYKGPNDTKINGVGVKPDYEVKLSDKNQLVALSSLAPMIENKSYKSGDVGLNVYAAQQRLTLLGFSLKVNGQMDSTTVAVIKSFQKQNKLPISGALDMNTKKSLEEKIQQLYNRITSDTQLDKAIEVLKNK